MSNLPAYPNSTYHVRGVTVSRPASVVAYAPAQTRIISSVPASLPVLISNDPARSIATTQLNALASDHMVTQERVLNTIKNLNNENEKLQELVEQRREAIAEGHKRASEALQNKMKDDQKALQLEAETSGRAIQQKIQELNEATQERNQKYFEAQKKIIAEYQKLMQKRKE